MKKIIFTLFLMIGAICANAQTAKIYKGGTVVQSIDNIDSVRFSQETTPVDEPAYTFSVAADKKVVFSPGNLQYTQSTNTWAFAEHQYDIIGEANVSDGALADKIDLFGWSSTNTATPFGVSLSKTTADYAGDFVDWGTNTIGADAPNTWRTMTSNEWQYLIGSRTNAAQLMGVAHIQLSADGTEYMNGLILLPDSWVCPEGVTFKSGAAGIYGKDAYADYQTIVLADWQRMEAAGAVFLPAAGDRDGLEMDGIANDGYYWLATPAYYSGSVMSIEFDSEEIYANTDNSCDMGLAVRLVKDFGEPAMPSGKFFVAADKQITFSPGNLQYTQSTNTWSFAEHQYDIIGEANVSEGALADKIDLFGWSSTNTATPFGVSLSKTTADYAGDFVDWGTNTIGTDAPNTWRTLTKDEWTYLFQHTHWTMAKVDDLLGFMLLPDGFVAPAGITVTILGDGTLSGSAQYFSESDYASNTYTAAEFTQLEAAGVVFLPCAANRVGKTVVAVGEYGNYWSATRNDDEAWNLYTISTGVMRTEQPLYTGYSVRLVKDFGEPAMPSSKFSVAADKQITFSPGNLQYTQSTNTWAFAANQYDIIGKANVSEGALADKIDLFGWSTTNTATSFGVSISDTDADYKGAFVDWGTNTIGSYAPNTWRTLTKDEWDYLFRTRPNADKRNGIARIYIKEDKSQYADGLILLPDDWTCPEGIIFKEGGAAGTNAYADHQTFTLAQWQALEEAGAVFLPAAGARNGATVGDIMDYGFYWSATAEETEDEGLLRAYTFYVEPDNIMLDVYDRKSGQSVRLVRDVQAPAAGSPAHTSAESTKEITTQVVTVYQPSGKVSRFNDVDSVVFVETPAVAPGAFSVSADKQITFSPGNLQYTQSTNTWAFAEQQYDIIGEANIISGALADKIDFFGWSASNTTAPFGVSLSTNKADYAGDFVDWGTNTIGTDAPNTWRTLTSDEWTYLFQHTHWTMAKVNGVLGLMLLPDGFVAPTGITVTILGDGTLSDSGFNFNESEYAGNVYTAAVFAQLESLGVVFLPCAGYRQDATVHSVGSYGGIWLATSNSADDVWQVYFESTEVLLDSWYRYIGLSVRLVKDL